MEVDYYFHCHFSIAFSCWCKVMCCLSFLWLAHVYYYSLQNQHVSQCNILYVSLCSSRSWNGELLLHTLSPNTHEAML